MPPPWLFHFPTKGGKKNKSKTKSKKHMFVSASQLGGCNESGGPVRDPAAHGRGADLLQGNARAPGASALIGWLQGPGRPLGGETNLSLNPFLCWLGGLPY